MSKNKQDRTNQNNLKIPHQKLGFKHKAANFASRITITNHKVVIHYSTNSHYYGKGD